jgi:hypothetical protein
VVPIGVLGDMCEPASFELVCRDVGRTLVEHGMLEPERFEHRTADIGVRMKRLGQWANDETRAAGLNQTPVLASNRQAGFCAGLGLRVVGTFAASDVVTPGHVGQAVESGRQGGARLIVANQPQGRQLADALADRLDARVVVFANFPDGNHAGAFDELVRRNVSKLVAVESGQ